jgi:hypothetical protein
MRLSKAILLGIKTFVFLNLSLSSKAQEAVQSDSSSIRASYAKNVILKRDSLDRKYFAMLKQRYNLSDLEVGQIASLKKQRDSLSSDIVGAQLATEDKLIKMRAVNDSYIQGMKKIVLAHSEATQADTSRKP